MILQLQAAFFHDFVRNNAQRDVCQTERQVDPDFFAVVVAIADMDVDPGPFLLRPNPRREKGRDRAATAPSERFFEQSLRILLSIDPTLLVKP